MEINEIKYGFKLLDVTPINDISATLYHYEHLKSGGNVYYLACEDTNCAFTIGFRTLPQDSTGVCHIIEHSLLCGSEKYPLKEPFVNLLKTSLATFLNAFTASDWTMYPFSSQTPKDFDNILSIYLDAVFNPLSVKDPKPFLQEGWHLELNSKDGLPSYKGVVYNEMKGAMSSVDRVLNQATNEAMYPDTIYRHNSGGDPEVIPSLTYEDYKAFYKKHYTPENAMTYFYGKMDIEEKLKFLDEEYFSKFDKTGEEITIEKQKPVINLNYEKDYEIGKEESLKDNTYMSLCYALDSFDNYEELLAMQILNDALLSKNDSPLKKKLLDAKLGENVYAVIDDGNITPSLTIVLEKTNKDKKELFKETFENAVRDIVSQGIDKSLLLASINFSEFKDKELDMGRMPKGLIFAMNMMGSFNYKGDITSHLQFSKHYEKFKRELDNGYFEKLLEKYILNSVHNVEVVVNPSNTLGEERNRLMEEKMKAIKESMSEQEIEDLIKLNQDLALYQNHIDTKEELSCLPKLSLKDIPTSVNYLDSKKVQLKKMEGFTHTINTNKIAYTRLYFNLERLTEEEIPYVTLLTSLYLNVPTKKHSSLELTNLIKTYLGDFSFKVSTFGSSKDDASLYLSVSLSAILENVSYIPSLTNEVLMKSKFTKKEVLQVLKQMQTAVRNEIIENGMRIAMNDAKSHFSKQAYYYSLYANGPKFFDFLNNLLKDFSYKDFVNKLKEISSKIFTYDNVKVSISGDKETLSLLKRQVKKIKLYDNSYENRLSANIKEPTKEALIVPSQVSYNALAGNLENVNEKLSGKYLVLSHIVNYDYLWVQVRVKGGAYGCSLSAELTNDVCFGSYRDPNVVNTYAAFKDVVTYLKNFKVSKDEFNNYIIGALGGFDSPMSTPLTIDTADLYYLRGYSKKDKMNLKKEMLHTSVNDIRSLGDVFEKLIPLSSESTIGNEQKIKEYSFEKVKSL